MRIVSLAFLLPVLRSSCAVHNLGGCSAQRTRTQRQSFSASIGHHSCEFGIADDAHPDAGGTIGAQE